MSSRLTDNVTARIEEEMRETMQVKPVRLPTSVEFASKNCLHLHPPGISKTGTD